jgi:hypothetical protein
VGRLARKLLGILAELTDPPTLRVADADSRGGRLIQVCGVPGTVMKAVAELTRMGKPLNPRDKKGDRAVGWQRSSTPALF